MTFFRCGCVLFLLLVAITTVATAQSTNTFSFQGRLTDANGAAVEDGSYAVDFALYTALTGGDRVWRETQTVTITDGIFTVQLGSVMPLAALPFDEPYFLSLTVEGETMAPRTPLTATPYALRAQRLDPDALQAGSNVTISENSDGTLRISSTSSGGVSGLASVTSDATLDGDGTANNPLGLASGGVDTDKLANGAVTGAKLATNALVAGMNVTIVERGNGSLEISSTGGGGGLTSVTSDATLGGDGTSGSPLAVNVPLELTGAATFGIIRGEHSNGNYGVFGTDNFGVYGEHSSGSRGWIGSTAQAVYGQHSNGNTGVLGDASNGVVGSNSNGNYGWVGGSVVSVLGRHNNGNQGGLGEVGFGVAGQHGSSGNRGWLGGGNYGAYGEHGSNGNWGALGTSTYAGLFEGDVQINGTLTGGSASFKIDHPLDPENKYLSHTAIESPDMKTVYDGTVTTDAHGKATVTLPDYFEALNRDFRYQLTAIGQFAQAIIAEEIQGNRFVIRTDQPGVKVSWQVTGIRQDRWAEANRIVAEQDKPAKEHGFYLHPKLYGQPEERSVLWANDREGMRTLREMPARLEEQRQAVKATQARLKAEQQ